MNKVRISRLTLMLLSMLLAVVSQAIQNNPDMSVASSDALG